MKPKYVSVIGFVITRISALTKTGIQIGSGPKVKRPITCSYLLADTNFSNRLVQTKNKRQLRNGV